MALRLFTTSVIALVLTACGNPQTKSESPATPADINVRATSDLEAPNTIIAATFVPNSVASWFGHIIMIDEKGRLHRSTTDSKVRLVDSGKYKSILGLARIKQAGVFLAITQKGALKAFIEADDDGNFKNLPISIGDGLRLTEFCDSAAPNTDSILAIDTSGKVQSFAITITDNTSVDLKALGPTGQDGCKAPMFNSDSSLDMMDDSDHMAVDIDGKKMSVSVINGLSISGIKSPSFTTVTTANMGSVFNNGLVLVAEKDTGRVVLIARDYFIEALGGQE